MSDTTIRIRYFKECGDDYIAVDVDGEEIYQTGYDSVGPEGFYAIEELTRNLAEALGAEVIEAVDDDD